MDELSDFDKFVLEFKKIKISDLTGMQIHLLLRLLNEKLDEIRESTFKDLI